MKDLQNIVYKFMETEGVTLKQALVQSSLGACAKTGDISAIVHGVIYNGYPYTDERKRRIAEHLGELLFYWLMMASTTGQSPEQIIAEYVSSYIKKTKIMNDEEMRLINLSRDKLLEEKTHAEQTQQQAQASILEMLKYVKAQEVKESKLKERAK